MSFPSSAWRPILDGALEARAREAIVSVQTALREPTLLPHEGGIAGGAAGVALFYYYLARNTDVADDALDTLLSRALEDMPDAATFYSGYPGVSWVLAHVMPPDEADEALTGIDRRIAATLELDERPHFDLTNGLTGLAVYALERLPAPAAVAALERIVSWLRSTAEPAPPGVRFFTPPDARWMGPSQRELHPNGWHNLGVAHGAPGPIAVLAACAAQRVGTGADALAHDTLRWLWAQQLGGEGLAFPKLAGQVTPAGKAWCYGDVGIATVLLAAARALADGPEEARALAIARRAAQSPIPGGLPWEIPSAGLCHGAAGLGHMFNRLHQATGEMVFRDAARAWLERAMSLPLLEGGVGLLEGAAGVGLALLAATSDVEPAWDRVLLLSLRSPDDR